MIAFQYLSIALAVILTSCFFFPFVLEALPFVNSKMMLAVVGLVWFGLDLLKKHEGFVNKDFLNLLLWALVVSLISFMSITINNTPDDTLVTYFISMCVWLSGAYTVVSLLKVLHGKVTVPLIVNYLLAVCVLQCVLALIFDNFPEAAAWHIDTFAGESFMGNTEDNRMHGIGCSLDVAGFRFSAVIVMVSYLVYYKSKQHQKQNVYLYLFVILFIGVVGNMISRSTVIGLACALLFFLFVVWGQQKTRLLLGKLILVVALVVVVTIWLYNINAAFRENLRFGFEGFFSLVETGEWKTNSNDILKEMLVWPETFKTWIIGDGYLNNPEDASLSTYDPYYVGEIFGGYYKGTDIGYLRYIYYFGMAGLMAFSFYFVAVCRVCIRQNAAFKWMFIMVLAINFIQWFKVSTDLFVVFAPFLCISLWKEHFMSVEKLPLINVES